MILVKFFSTLTFYSLLIFPHFLKAQTVEKVQGSQVLLSVQGSETIKVGEKVHFLSGTLEVVGRGEVIKVSDGGRKALAKISSGKVSKGMSVERVTSPQVASPTATSSPQLSPYDPNGFNYPTNLTQEDLDILRIGPISDGQYIAGGLLGIYPGLGIGHAVQGRWLQKGWIFTVGESVSAAVAVVGALRCIGYERCDNTLLLAGVVGLYGFKIWEIFDVWWTPRGWNDRYYQLRRRPSDELSWHGILVPTKDGFTAGLGMTF